MALYKKLNYATGTLASGIADDAVEITLGAGHTITTDTGIDNNFIGVFFASTESSPYQDATREIVDAYRTDTNTFTITRAQEGTSAKAWSQDDNFMLIASAGVFNEYETEINSKEDSLPVTPADPTLKYLNGSREWARITPSDIVADTLLGTPTYSTQNDYNNSFGSTGRKTGGECADMGSSKVSIAAGTGFIKATDDDNAQLVPFNWDAVTDITIPADSLRYIGVEYNSGSPQIVVKESPTWDLDTEFPLARVANDTINGVEELYITNTPWWITDGMTNVIQVIRSFGLIRRDDYVGGLMLSGTGTRNIAVSSGTVWAGLNDYDFAGIDTSVTGSVEGYWYESVDGWNSTPLTQWSKTQWNDVTQNTLQTIDNNKYCNVWIYGEMNVSTPSVSLLYPQAQYNTAAEAEAKLAPDNIPNHIRNLGMLLGRFIIKQNVDTPVSVQSVFTTDFSTSVATNHANLANLDYASAGHTGFAPSTNAVLTTPNIGAAIGTSLALEGTTLGILNLKNTTASSYTRMLFDGTGTDFSQGVGNASAAIADLQNKFYIYDFTNSKTAFTIVPNTLAAKFYGSLEAINLSGTNTGDEVAASSAEINTGTDETKYVTPDALAGSNAFTKPVQQYCVEWGTELAVEDGVGYIEIPAELNGMNLISARARVGTPGVTGNTTFDIYNVTDSQSMLSSAITIASGATSGTGTVDTAHDDVATGDLIRIDCDTLSDTKPKGLIITLAFRLA